MSPDLPCCVHSPLCEQQFTVHLVLCCQMLTSHRDLLRHPSPCSVIAPPVSSGWVLAPTPRPLGERSPWVRLFARTGPPSPLDSPETSRSSTSGFSAQNLKQSTNQDAHVKHKRDQNNSRDYERLTDYEWWNVLKAKTLWKVLFHYEYCNAQIRLRNKKNGNQHASHQINN